MAVEPLAGLTRTLRAMLGGYIGLLAIALAAALLLAHSYASNLTGIEPGVYLSAEEMHWKFAVRVQAVYFLVLAVVFLRWTYRINENLQALSSTPLRFSPGWSVCWYFIPIAHLFMPYRVMKELWFVSHRFEAASRRVLVIWWALWVTSICFAITLPTMLVYAGVDPYFYGAVLDAALVALDIPLTITALMVVSRIGLAYERNFEESLNSSGHPQRESAPIPSY